MDNQIEQSECRTCRVIGMIIAAIITGLVAYNLLKTQELWVAILILICVLLVGLFLVNWFCCRNIGRVLTAEASPTTPSESSTDTSTIQDIPEVMAEPSLEPIEEETSEVSAPVPPTPAVNVEATQDSEGDDDEDGDNAGQQPETLAGPRDGKADDLKKIKGVGPKLEKLLNSMGFYHFDQIANWSADEVAWVDANLDGFKGRVSRDDWVDQAQTLADGGETAFSQKVDKGDVY